MRVKSALINGFGCGAENVRIISVCHLISFNLNYPYMTKPAHSTVRANNTAHNFPMDCSPVGRAGKCLLFMIWPLT